MRIWASNALLVLQVWQLSCSHASPEDVMAAVSGAARVFSRCGIKVRAEGIQRLKAEGPWCELPGTAKERKPILMDISRTRRLKNLRGLSVFVLPTAKMARNAFSVIDEAPDAGCGSPQNPEYLPDSGSIFLSDFGLAQDQEFSAALLSHEIAHELTMRQHPTRRPRGSVLADHIADYGPRISDADCACMLQSPFLRKP